MKEKHFIVDSEDINQRKKTLVLKSIEEDGWKKHFEDFNTNEKWIEYRMEPEYHGGGYPILVKQPVPNTKELIQIALSSENLDQIAGASIFLYSNEENEKVEFREQLIDEIEKFVIRKEVELSEVDRTKLKIIIYDTFLYDPTNRRNILGKHYSEIEKDYNYFIKVSVRAKQILNKIK